jgi:hypothetical protein
MQIVRAPAATLFHGWQKALIGLTRAACQLLYTTLCVAVWHYLLNVPLHSG